MISAELLNRPVEKGAGFGLTLSARSAEPGDRATASVPRSYRLGRPVPRAGVPFTMPGQEIRNKGPVVPWWMEPSGHSPMRNRV